MLAVLAVPPVAHPVPMGSAAGASLGGALLGPQHIVLMCVHAPCSVQATLGGLGVPRSPTELHRDMHAYLKSERCCIVRGMVLHSAAARLPEE